MEQLTQFVSMSFAMRARRAAADICSRDDAWRPEDAASEPHTQQQLSDLHGIRPSVLRQLTTNNNKERNRNKSEDNVDDSSAFRSAAQLPPTGSSSPASNDARHQPRREERPKVGFADDQRNASGDDRPMTVLVGGNHVDHGNDDDASDGDGQRQQCSSARSHDSSESIVDTELGRSSDIDVETVADKPPVVTNGTGGPPTLDGRTSWFIANVLGRRLESSMSGNGERTRM